MMQTRPIDVSVTLVSVVHRLHLATAQAEEEQPHMDIVGSGVLLPLLPLAETTLESDMNTATVADGTLHLLEACHGSDQEQDERIVDTLRRSVWCK